MCDIHAYCAGEPVTMVTLGGSISAGQGVSVSGDAYIPRVYDWIQTVFPNKKHRWLPFISWDVSMQRTKI